VNLGIFGGSFDPVHVGHLVTAERVAEAAGLDRVLMVVAARSPFKTARKLAPAGERLALLRLALRGHPVLEASDLEVRRGGVSYTVDTVRELRRRHPRASLHLILGADAAAQLSDWKSLPEIAREVRFVLVGRPGHGRLPPRLPKKLTVDGLPRLEVSSTSIRERLRRGLSVRWLLPEAVERRVRRKGLYGRS
jgi:nicotinate-nucleotide adenylyltransferase